MDIDKCKNDFHTAMHDIYNFLAEEDEKQNVTESNKKEEEKKKRKNWKNRIQLKNRKGNSKPIPKTPSDTA